MNDSSKMSELASSFVAKLGDKNNDEAKRRRAYLELKQYLGLDFLELTPEQADAFLDGFNEPIRRLLETQEPGPIKGAILAIECIVSLESKNKIARLNRFANFLRNLLRNRQLVVLEPVACAVCRICVHALAFTTDLVIDQITRSLEWMRDSNLNQLAALYVLRELAQNAPNHFFQHAQSFFDGIFVPLRHKEPEIREAAGFALFSALCVLVDRESRDSASVAAYWLACIEEFARPKGTESQRDDRTHGQLLILLQLLRLANTHFDLQWRQLESFAANFSATSSSPVAIETAVIPATTTSSILSDHFTVENQSEGKSANTNEMAAFPESRSCRRLVLDNLASILSFVQNAMIQKPATVQRAILQISPRLAAISLNAFRPQLERTVVHMTNLAKRGEPSVKPCALTAMAMLILAVGPEILRNRSVLYDCISSALTKVQTSERAFLCMSALAQVCGSPAIDEVPRLIDQAVLLGLTPGLPICFRWIVVYCPDLERKIKDGIVTLVHNVLQLAPSQALSRSIAERRTSSAIPMGVFANSGGVLSNDYTQVKLALQAIQLFRFDKETSRDLLGRVVAVCLEHEKAEVRIDAVPVVMRLMQLDIELLEAYLRQYHRYGQETLRFVTARLRDLVRLGLVDSDPNVRLKVLHALFSTERMDPFLAQQEILDMLFLTLNDDDPLVRREAVALLGRLCNMNCGAILPKLRSVLLHNLLELEHLGSPRLKESAVEAVSWLLSCCSHIATAYAQPAIATMLRLLKDDQQSASLIVTSLQSIGTLARVSPMAVSLHCDDLINIFVSQLSQPATAAGARRRAALGAFCQLMTYVPQKSNIHPTYPSFLDVLLTLIRTENDKDMQQTAVRLLGLIGALDPARQQEMQHVDNSFELGYNIALSTPKQPDTPSFVECDLLTADLLIQFSSQQMEDYYPAVAMAALLQTLKDPSMAKHEKSAVETLGRVFEYLGPSGAPYLEQVIPALIERLKSKDSDLEFKQLLIQRIGQMLAQARLYARPYLTNLLEEVKSYWYIPRLQPALFDLVALLASSLGPDFAPYVVLVAEHVSAHLFQMEELSPLVCLRELARCLHGYESLVVPGAVAILGNEASQVVQRKIACETLSSLIVHLNLADYLAVIVRAILRCLNSADTATINEIYPDLVNLLVRIVCQTGKKFAPFEPVVSERLKAAKPQATNDRHLYELAVTRYVRMSDSGLNDLVDGENTLERLAGLWPAAMQVPRPTASPAGGAGGPGPGGGGGPIVTATSGAIGGQPVPNFRKTKPILANLRLKWNIDHCKTTEDWQTWLKELGVAMLKESSSTALRTCAPGILQDCPSLVLHLFNSAFLSCWEELNEASQDELMTALHQALAANSDATILHQILDLFDLFKHSEFGSGGNLIKNCIAGEAALRCRAFAKALRHYEDEFSLLTEAHKPIPHELWASLVDVHIRMDASESAKGVIRQFVKSSSTANVPETWFEKLGDWRGALKNYEQRQQENGQLLGDLAVRRMTCLKQLGDWEAVLRVGQESWSAILPEQQDVAAELMCSAALGLRDWDVLTRYGALQVNDTHAAHMFKAAIAVTKNSWRESLQQICLARQALTSQLATMIGEGYSRVYPHVIESQLLCELEEVVAVGMNPNSKAITKANWHMRVQNCRRQIDDWLGLLTVRGLILPVREQEQDWLKAATISNRCGYPELANRILCRLLDVPSLASCEGNFPPDSPLLALACLKQLWNEGSKEVAFSGLRRLVTENQTRLTLLPTNTEQVGMLKIYLSKCYRRLAHWQNHFSSTSNDEDAKMRALEYYHNATAHDEKSYKAWHEWAQANYDIVALWTQKTTSSAPPVASVSESQANDPQQDLQVLSPQSTTSLITPTQVSNWPTRSIAQQCCVAAVKGFARSVTLRPRDTIHDLVRLMSLWFEHGEWSIVMAGVRNCLPTVPVDAWLQLIPQLIARIDARNADVRDSVQQLLKTVGQLRPQALVYSLSVAAQATQATSSQQPLQRLQAAKMILQAVCEQNPQLVNETLMVSNELIRIAILWQERWHEGLEEASKAFYNDHNTAGMLEIIDQLYAEISRRPETAHEQSFLAMYDSELKGAKDFIDRYRRIQQQQQAQALQPNQANQQQVQTMAAAGNDCIVQAWHFFLNMFRKLTPQLQQMTSVELQFTSPQLYHCRDLNICVPGTYDPSKKIVTIRQVVPTVQVISSKQRPRKLSIFGSDGKEYVFLLKGHEDIRLDERVMQLFGLVNLLILQGAPNDKFSGTIQRFSVIPLNTNSGLIGWLPSCDTLHALIKEYRERRSVILNLEHRLMNQNCSTYDTLPIYHKMDVFEYALDRTKGDDLAKILWYKSPSSDVWFQRRQNYIRSLAVMSMVGYVLGLGDRHPSNLLLNRITGKIIHIDFGDCFEMAQKRERFPEKIPFRLTRMMVNAMEVTGIDGLFRASSEWTMRLLRQNKDSVLGVLEAFVYDPVINPRLMEQMQEGAIISHGSPSAVGTANGVVNGADDVAGRSGAASGQVNGPTTGQQQPAAAGAVVAVNHIPVAPAEAGRRSSAIINRVREKLFGRDFGPNELGVPEQVELLIEQAKSTEYLCQCYVGWCPFW